MKYYDRGWNPIFGCKGAFLGCDKCFSKTLMQKRNEIQRDFTEVKINKKQYEKRFDNAGELIAVCTQSDLFQDDIDTKIIDGILRKCNLNSQNHYLFLTKYSNNMKKYFDDNRIKLLNNNHINKFSFDKMSFGVSVCGNKDIHRIYDLQNTKHIKHRFIAFQPLLEKIEIEDNLLDNIQWVIVGAQTGNDASPCNDEWIQHIVNKAISKNIAVFVNSANDENKFEKYHQIITKKI